MTKHKKRLWTFVSVATGVLILCGLLVEQVARPMGKYVEHKQLIDNTVNLVNTQIVSEIKTLQTNYTDQDKKISVMDAKFDLLLNGMGYSNQEVQTYVNKRINGKVLE